MSKILLSIITLVVVAFGVIYFQNSRVPELGAVHGKLADLGSRPNSVSTQAIDESKRVATLPMKDSLATTRAAIHAAISGYGGAETMADEGEYIYVVFTTPLMKYHDDAEFYIDTAQRQVHFRSASRAGYSDRGLNRQRYTALAQTYADH